MHFALVSRLEFPLHNPISQALNGQLANKLEHVWSQHIMSPMSGFTVSCQPLMAIENITGHLSLIILPTFEHFVKVMV